MGQPRIIIVGAGPAGVSAAERLVAAGVRPLVIDESPRDGGQIYRRQPENFTRSYEELYGSEADRAQSLHQRFAAIRDKIDYLPDTLVWNVADQKLWTAENGAQHSYSYDALLLCTGATDRLMPVEGWQYAGCYSLGGAQVALKAQACSIGRRVVFMGSGPLLYLVASQYVKAGAHVVAVLDSAPFSARVRALPKLLSQPDILWAGVGLNWRLLKAGVPVYHGVTPLRIAGDADEGVSAVHFRDGRGRERMLACDAIAMGHHLRCETQLADLARCSFTYDAITRQWLPERDAEGRASVAGIYLAGDGVRVLGARAAEVSGRLIAETALADQGRLDADHRTALQGELKGYARFAQGLAEAFPWPAHFGAALKDEVVVCRCEGVTAGDIRHVLRNTHARETNRTKAFSRVGMGRCQGRYCGLAASEIIAAELQVAHEEVGRLRTQAPVKPISVSITREVVS